MEPSNVAQAADPIFLSLFGGTVPVPPGHVETTKNQPRLITDLGDRNYGYDSSTITGNLVTIVTTINSFTTIKL